MSELPDDFGQNIANHPASINILVNGSQNCLWDIEDSPVLCGSDLDDMEGTYYLTDLPWPYSNNLFFAYRRTIDGWNWNYIYVAYRYYNDCSNILWILPTPGEAKAKALPGRLYIHTK